MQQVFSDGCDIVIVNYNSSTYLTSCVTSSFNCCNKLIVVDNASTDNSIALCEEHYLQSPKLLIIRNNSNLGFAAACNIGYQASQSDYVLFLNPDCVLAPDAICEMLKVLQQDKSVGMVGGLLVNPDGTEQGGGRRAIPTPWRSFVRAFGLYRFTERWPKLFFDFYLHEQPLPTTPIEVEAISGACMLVKREAVTDVGLWDEKYFLHCEDLDWCMRFRGKGWKVMFVPTAKVTHALGVCSRKRPVFVEWHKHKGMMRFYHKFFKHQYPWGLMVLVAVGVWLRFVLLAGYYTMRRLTKS